MSVERKGNGLLRLACDGQDCDRKFVPQKPIADADLLRWRATMHGWLTAPKQATIPGIVAAVASANTRDLCPECRRQAT